ncbi:unnamed protein product [Parascedosporium putredinis]|uniref:Uncharacterized protein n=1 Tax=Parascedosporium putredinis TaxID=1442378 RepID=A0A9P1GXA1_9PEZI|nr:unnamed protein product [Parascedosporium putredinis]CAI7989582.1 unnamed protein product [Parascedosporium putredinis]
MDFLDIAKTCRRFYQIVLPLMYHRFSLSVGHFIITQCVPMPLKALKLLGRSLRENPSLGSYCKKIWLQLEHPRIPEGEPWEDIHLTDLVVDPDVLEGIQLTKDLVGLLTGVEDLYVTGGFHHYQHVGVWDIIATATARMPKLYELNLNHWSQPVPECTGPLLKCTALSTSLKHLVVDKIADHDSPLDKIANMRHPTIEQLTITTNRTGVERAKTLIAWPENLVELALETDPDGYGSAERPGIAQFMRLLGPQKRTLRKLALGSTKRMTGLQTFDVRDFDKLEELNVSVTSVIPEQGLQERLLAPGLRKFTLCFNTEGDQRDGVLPVGLRAQGDCLAAGLALLALERKVPLEEIFLDFYPDDQGMRPEELGDMIKSWEYIDQLRDELGPLGIKVKCASMVGDLVRAWKKCWGIDQEEKANEAEEEVEGGLEPWELEEDSNGDPIVPLDGDTQENKITGYFQAQPRP